jgi:hypothetical protein
MRLKHLVIEEAFRRIHDETASLNAQLHKHKWYEFKLKQQLRQRLADLSQYHDRLEVEQALLADFNTKDPCITVLNELYRHGNPWHEYNIALLVGTHRRAKEPLTWWQVFVIVWRKVIRRRKARANAL